MMYWKPWLWPSAVALSCRGCIVHPFFLCGTERIERRGHGAVMLFWGRILLLTWKLHFLLNPLHFDVHLVSSPTENGLARVGWAP